jgi:hypothetical protein
MCFAEAILISSFFLASLTILFFTFATLYPVSKSGTSEEYSSVSYKPDPGHDEAM